MDERAFDNKSSKQERVAHLFFHIGHRYFSLDLVMEEYFFMEQSIGTHR